MKITRNHALENMIRVARLERLARRKSLDSRLKQQTPEKVETRRHTLGIFDSVFIIWLST